MDSLGEVAVMSHVLHAVIGPKSAVAEFAARWHLARMIDLPQDFAMVPLTPALHDDIAELAGLNRPDPFAEFERLSAGVEASLKEVSCTGRLGSIETDYFGGSGTQSAVAWEGGRLLAGPFRTETTWDGSAYQAPPRGERAINRVLAALGVWTRGEKDAFDGLGLGRFRGTESAASKDA
jgi:hypothetical protein